MKKIVIAVLIIFLAIGVFSFVRFSTPNALSILELDEENEDGDNDLEKSSSPMISLEISSSSLKGLSALSVHSSQSDCWIGYNGKVYDITSWLPVHPGSAAAILPYCGTSKEFTDAFTKKHGTSKVSKLMKVGILIGDFEIKGNVA